MSSNHNEQSAARDSAEFLMVTNIPRITKDETIHDAKKLLATQGKTFSFVEEIYVVTATGRFVGVLSLKELFQQPDTRRIEDVMEPRRVSAHPHTDQERVAYLALRNKLPTVPVVDKRGVLLGAVPNHTLLSVMEQEVREDVLHMAGVHHERGVHDNIMTLRLGTALKHRLPWLLLGLLGGMFTAQVIGGFESLLNQYLVLVAFIPLIVNMGDAVGTQMEAFIIRDITVEENFTFRKYFSRQFFFVFVIGCITSAILFVAGVVLYDNARIAGVLALALLAAVLSSVSTGLFIPYFFSKLRLDPANASGPIASNIQDLLSVTIYLTIAAWLL